MGALTHWAYFLFFLRELLMFWPPVVVFRRLVRLGIFPACWRPSNVTPIPKGRSSSSVVNCRSLSITSVLSKVLELLVSVRHGRFMESSGVLPTTQFAYRKGLGTCDALLWVSHTLQSAFESGQEARILQIIIFISKLESAVQGWDTLSVQRPQPHTTNQWKEEKDKTVGDKKERGDHVYRKALALLLKHASPTPSDTGSLRSFQRDTVMGTKVLRY